MESFARSPRCQLRIYLVAKVSAGCVATASKTAGGTTRVRVHRWLKELGGEAMTEAVGQTSNVLDSLVGIEGLPGALLGNSGNIFYVWDCEEKVLVRKMIHEPDIFVDMRHVSWCSSDSFMQDRLDTD